MKEERGRNDPCPCGSGKKYKKCCGQSQIGKHSITAGLQGLGQLKGHIKPIQGLNHEGEGAKKLSERASLFSQEKIEKVSEKKGEEKD